MEKTLLLQIFILTAICGACSALPLRTNFEKCGYKGFFCENSKNVTGKVDLSFTCNTTVTTQDVLIYLWNFNSPGTILSFTINNCERVQLSFSCTSENKPIQSLKIQNVDFLEIIPAVLTHNPPEIYFQNVKYIENIPRNSFGQIKYDTYKPGCFNPINDLNIINFKDVNIGNIETEAFRNLKLMKSFSWTNVSVNRVSVGSIKLNFESEAGGELNGCKFGVLEPLAFQVIGDSFSISRGRFADIWGSALNGTIYDFQFNNNTVANIQASAISIMAQNVHILDNHFENIESGAFQRISPGLLYDSKKNFGKLNFVYKFSSNLIESVEDGGIRPDIQAYKNVASDVTYTSNTLQCSCDGLSWLGADVDLGLGHSVIKDFNTMILEPQNDNICTFTPCMCFGVKPPSKKTNVEVAVF